MVLLCTHRRLCKPASYMYLPNNSKALDCKAMEKIEQISEDKVVKIVVRWMRAKRVCEPVNGLANISCLSLSLLIQFLSRVINSHCFMFSPPASVNTGPELGRTHKIFKRALDICNHYNVRAETHVVIGEPKEKICEAAHKLEAHFLVMGSHGHGPFIRAIKGSVSDHCSRNAVCPVVIVNKKVS